MEKLVKFIKKNELDFSGEGSDLNSNFTVLCGYCDYIGERNQDDIEKAVLEANGIRLTYHDKEHLEDVLNFATTYNYGNWWKTPEAKKMYKF